MIVTSSTFFMILEFLNKIIRNDCNILFLSIRNKIKMSISRAGIKSVQFMLRNTTLNMSVVLRGIDWKGYVISAPEIAKMWCTFVFLWFFNIHFICNVLARMQEALVWNTYKHAFAAFPLKPQHYSKQCVRRWWHHKHIFFVDYFPVDNHV